MFNLALNRFFAKRVLSAVLFVKLKINYMNTMNKQFEHRGYNFNIKVELNTKVERGMNGDRYHTITVNCMDKDNYYVKEEVNDKHLTLYIHSAIIVAQKYVDEKLDGASTADKRLTELGFK